MMMGDREKHQQFFQEKLAKANEGDVDAQYWVANCYDLGRGVDEDMVEAARRYKMAAEQGSAKAEYQLGDSYWYGRGLDEDEELGKFLWEKAIPGLNKEAESGDSESMYLLGLAFGHGDGVEDDQNQALMWYEKSAAKGHASAQLELSNLYKYGRVVAKDLEKAFQLMLEAAENGIDRAQMALAQHYEKESEGCNWMKSIQWYQRAAENGNNLAPLNLERLLGQIADRRNCLMIQLKTSLEQSPLGPGLVGSLLAALAVNEYHPAGLSPTQSALVALVPEIVDNK